MRRWLAQTLANTRLRGEEPRTRFARQPARWFPATPTVPESRFQGPGERFPRHWRRPPEPWATTDASSPEVQRALAAALAGLPATWRAVITARDAHRRDPAEVSERFGLTRAEQQAILHRARAAVRDRLARSLSPGADR